MLKSLGLSLDSIKDIPESEHHEKILLLLLDEKEKEIGFEISDRQKQLKAIQIVRGSITGSANIPVQTIKCRLPAPVN